MWLDLKEHIMSLKLAKKLNINVKLYRIFLVTRVQSFLQCNTWFLQLGRQKMLQYIALCNIRHIVLYCSNEYCNML